MGRAYTGRRMLRMELQGYMKRGRPTINEVHVCHWLVLEPLSSCPQLSVIEIYIQQTP